MRFHRSAAIAAVGLSVLLVSCAPAASDSGSGSGQDVPTVRVSQAFQSLLYLPLYVAAHEGFFEGIDVDIQTGGGGQQSWSSVLGGSADFSIHDPVFGAISKSEGGPGIAVASVQNAPAVWIVGNEDADYQDDISALVGSAITTMPEPDTTWAFMNYLLKESDIGADDVKIVPTSIGNEMAPLLAGQTDFSLGTEPQISQVEAEGKHVVYSFADNPDWYPYAFSSLMTTETYTAEHPEETQALVTGFERASRFIYENPERAVEIAQEEFPELEADVVEAAVLREISVLGYPETVAITPEAWSNLLRISDFVGIVDAEADTSAYETVVNNEWAEAAKEAVDGE